MTLCIKPICVLGILAVSIGATAAEPLEEQSFEPDPFVEITETAEKTTFISPARMASSFWIPPML